LQFLQLGLNLITIDESFVVLDNDEKLVVPKSKKESLMEGLGLKKLYHLLLIFLPHSPGKLYI